LGTIPTRLPLNVEEVLVAEVPLIDARTLASRIGQTFPLLCGGLAIAIALASVRRRLRTAHATTVP